MAARANPKWIRSRVRGSSPVRVPGYRLEGSSSISTVQNLALPGSLAPPSRRQGLLLGKPISRGYRRYREIRNGVCKTVPTAFRRDYRLDMRRVLNGKGVPRDSGRGKVARDRRERRECTTPREVCEPRGCRVLSDPTLYREASGKAHGPSPSRRPADNRALTPASETLLVTPSERKEVSSGDEERDQGITVETYGGQTLRRGWTGDWGGKRFNAEREGNDGVSRQGVPVKPAANIMSCRANSANSTGGFPEDGIQRASRKWRF